MKQITRLTKKISEFCHLSEIDETKVKNAMKSNLFSVQKCETKTEMEEEGVDFSFPYVICNPYNFDIKL